MFSSCLLSVSVPEVLCMAKKRRKIIEVKSILEMQRFLLSFNSNCSFAKKKIPPESRVNLDLKSFLPFLYERKPTFISDKLLLKSPCVIF